MCAETSDPAHHQGGTASGPQRLAGCRILVVEDEYFLADDVARILLRHGVDAVGPVPTRDDALACLSSEERLDAAVLDINLRGEMSFPVADALAARGVPFVFTTGYEPAAIPSAYRHVPHLEKPFETEALVQVLSDLLQGR